MINEAIRAASLSDVIRGKIGAVLFRDNGHIIAKAHNVTFHGSNRFRTIHAEEALIQKAWKIRAIDRYGSNLNVLVLRYVPGTNRISNAKPCANCQRVLSKTPFTVYNSTEEGTIEKFKNNH